MVRKMRVNERDLSVSVSRETRFPGETRFDSLEFKYSSCGIQIEQRFQSTPLIPPVSRHSFLTHKWLQCVYSTDTLIFTSIFLSRQFSCHQHLAIDRTLEVHKETMKNKLTCSVTCVSIGLIVMSTFVVLIGEWIPLGTATSSRAIRLSSPIPWEAS